jgi:hypothetical protein
MLTRTKAIKNFLTDYTHADLAGLYNHGMEVQVNVAQDGGTRVEGEGFKGRMWHGYSDGNETWKAIRIPWSAATKPRYDDVPMTFNLASHAEAIGMTGWNWEHRVSKWVAFDFDGISGHSEGHAAKLTDQELQEVQEAACQLPWVTVRKSSGGQGLHLYVFLDNVPTANHTEHAALGRSILGKMSTETGFDFAIKVDACGGNIWVFHRKMKGTDGLTLVKQGVTLSDIPINWQDHVDVIKKKQRRSQPSQIKTTELSAFEELTSQRQRTKLDVSHKKLLDYLRQSKASWWFDNDHWMLVCHTYDLKKAHEDLCFRGVFDTLATGKDKGADWNVYCFPLADPPGAWSVRRYTPGVVEAACWEQDASGWTQCYYNRDPSLRIASRTFDGIEDEKGDYHFNEAETASSTARMLGADLKLPPWACSRQTIIKQHKDGRLIVHVKREPTDNYGDMIGWREDKGWWKRLFNARLTQAEETGSFNFDNTARHVSTGDGHDLGWVVKSHDTWHIEPMQHIKVALKALDLSDKEINKALGNCVLDPWTEVNEPFQDEYPGGRRWNRKSAQFRYLPQVEEPFKHPTWDLVLKHCGRGLDNVIKENGWCQANGLITGENYLRVWIASLFQFPKKPLPYLFLYSKTENTGKSTLHEALSLLINDTGYARADTALTSAQGFNGELVNAVLCVIQETDISKSVGSRNRLKDWVLALQFPVHIKNRTPYLIPNTTHYIHTANDHRECPIFPGDTRITVIHVPSLEPLEMIPRDELHVRLKREAPAFLGMVLRIEIPYSSDRLNVPVLETKEKIQSARLNRTDFEIFLEETIHYAPGEIILYSDLWARFQEWLSPEDIHLWSKIRMGRELPMEYPKGRVLAKGGKFHVGNMSFEKPASITANQKLALVGDALIEDDK